MKSVKKFILTLLILIPPFSIYSQSSNTSNTEIVFPLPSKFPTRITSNGVTLDVYTPKQTDLTARISKDRDLLEKQVSILYDQYETAQQAFAQYKVLVAEKDEICNEQTELHNKSAALKNKAITNLEDSLQESQTKKAKLEKKLKRKKKFAPYKFSAALVVGFVMGVKLIN